MIKILRSLSRLQLLLWGGGALLLLLLVYMAFQGELETGHYVAFGWIFSVIVLLWLGNYYLYHLLDSKYPWAEYVSRRFFLQLLASTIYSLLCINLTYYVFKSQLLGFPPDASQMIVVNLYALLFLLPVISIVFGIYFLMQWKRSFMYSEQLKSEHLHSQFESLKNHLDPHFLFNSLNILYSLIENDRDAALDFLDHFTDVYRYVLKHKNTELVPLGKELEFIVSYRYMLETRFRDQLEIRTNIPQQLYHAYLPPMALQMLIENAIKHNKASDVLPLYIDIFTDDHNKLVVKNNLQLKLAAETGFSAGSGLNNIKNRYAYLSDQVPEIRKSDAAFIVKLPLLTIKAKSL